MEGMFTEAPSSSSVQGKRPAYMVDRSMVEERARAALTKIPHSKAPAVDEEGQTDRDEERLHDAAVWLQSEKSKVRTNYMHYSSWRHSTAHVESESNLLPFTTTNHFHPLSLIATNNCTEKRIKGHPLAGTEPRQGDGNAEAGDDAPQSRGGASTAP